MKRVITKNSFSEREDDEQNDEVFTSAEDDNAGASVIVEVSWKKAQSI